MKLLHAQVIEALCDDSDGARPIFGHVRVDRLGPPLGEHPNATVSATNGLVYAVVPALLDEHDVPGLVSAAALAAVRRIKKPSKKSPWMEFALAADRLLPAGGEELPIPRYGDGDGIGAGDSERFPYWEAFVAKVSAGGPPSRDRVVASFRVGDLALLKRAFGLESGLDFLTLDFRGESKPVFARPAGSLADLQYTPTPLPLGVIVPREQ